MLTVLDFYTCTAHLFYIGNSITSTVTIGQFSSYITMMFDLSFQGIFFQMNIMYKLKMTIISIYIYSCQLNIKQASCCQCSNTLSILDDRYLSFCTMATKTADTLSQNISDEHFVSERESASSQWSLHHMRSP